MVMSVVLIHCYKQNMVNTKILTTKDIIFRQKVLLLTLIPVMNK